MQLIVLGMHRSGTSAVTRLLNLMGAYFGGPDAGIPANDENPEGFWERRDMRAICDGVLHGTDADWWKVTDFRLDAVPAGVAADNVEAFRHVVQSDLDQHQPWVIKEPRLCLLLPLFRPLLQRPVAVFVHRDPLEVARSLEHRNGFPVPVGVALWEVYVRGALQASADMPRVFVRHADVMSDPVAAVKQLFADLQAQGVDGLRLPADEEITAFIQPDLYRHRVADDQRQQFLNPPQLELAAALDEGAVTPELGSAAPTGGAMEVLGLFERLRATRAQRRRLREQVDSLKAELARRDGPDRGEGTGGAEGLAAKARTAARRVVGR